MTKVVGLLGSTGFVGRHVASALAAEGAIVRPVTAPRLLTQARDVDALVHEADSRAVEREALRTQLSGCDAVINAAGVADAVGQGNALFGANALLPAVAGLAAPQVRFVHVSSAAVQGRRAVLDETEEYLPFSPYSNSKALGEQALHRVAPHACCYRPTSVHGAGRQVTAKLARLLGGPFASAAGAGDRPTPQVLVSNVAAVASFLALGDEPLPRAVLHPWEGLTTGGLVRRLGGRDPKQVPDMVARAVVRAAFSAGRASSGIVGQARRLEMLWFGQEQAIGWLEGRVNVLDFDSAWEALR